MTSLLVTVRAPHMCASLIVRDGVVTEAAPILRWSRGWDRVRLWRYLKRKGWQVTVQPDPSPTSTEKKRQ